MINKVILIGNLGRDPEVRRLESGSAVAKFSVATNENYRDKSGEWQTQTEWHNIVVWRALAERAERDLKKGSLVYIEGKLTHRSWQDQDGRDRYTTEVVAYTLRSLDRREGGGRGFGDDFPGSENEPESTSTFSSPTPVADTSTAEKQLPSEDDDLPF